MIGRIFCFMTIGLVLGLVLGLGSAPLLAVDLPQILSDEYFFEQSGLLEEQITQIESDSGPFSDRLFEPLMSLARLQIDFGDFETATDTLHRAQNILHRDEGVYTPRQLGVIDLLTNMALSDGDYRDADRQQRFSFFLTQRFLEEDDPAKIAAYQEMAEWFMFTGQPRRARRLLKEGIAMAERLQINPLPLAITLNQARRVEGLCCSSRRLEGTLQGVTKSESDTLAATYLELGDSLILSRKGKQAAEYFAKAAELSPMGVSAEPVPIMVKRTFPQRRANEPQRYRLERDVFDRPTLDRMSPQEMMEDTSVEPQWFMIDVNRAHKGFTLPDIGSNPAEDRTSQGLIGHPVIFSEEQLENLVPLSVLLRQPRLRIEISFTVMSDGDLEDVTIVSSNAPNKLDRLLIDSLRRVHYRPALENGIPVTRENVRLTQTFERIFSGV